MKSRYFISGIIIILAVTLDELIGRYVLNELHDSVYITSFLNLVHAWNKGIAFGLFNTASSNFIFIWLTIVIMFVLTVMLVREEDKAKYIPYALILGGACGNLIDRLRYKAVFDFIDLHIVDFHWPAFNFADAFIWIGSIMVAGNILLGNKTLQLQ